MLDCSYIVFDEEVSMGVKSSSKFHRAPLLKLQKAESKKWFVE